MKLLLNIERFLITYDSNNALKFALVWYVFRYILTVKLIIRNFCTVYL